MAPEARSAGIKAEPKRSFRFIFDTFIPFLQKLVNLKLSRMNFFPRKDAQIARQ
jgi:hypothetical protein